MMGLSETQAKVAVNLKNRGLNHGLFQSPDLEVLGDVSYCCRCSVSVCAYKTFADTLRSFLYTA